MVSACADEPTVNLMRGWFPRPRLDRGLALDWIGGAHRKDDSEQMSGWWHDFLELPDRARAKVLARVALGAIIALFYALGGISLYLRAHYLKPTSAAQMQSPTPAAFEPTATSRPATATLYPTITLRAVGHEVNSATPVVTRTPTRGGGSATTLP